MAAPMAGARIHRLTLTNFRNYRSAALAPAATVVVLTGANGAGKTNVLEAISFLAPGRGLRRAALDDVAFAEGDGSWAVAADVEGALGLVTLGTGLLAPAGADTVRQRQCRIDREPVPSAAVFADHLDVVWLTPAMDTLFVGPAAERRRFIDRIALALDREHGRRVTALERALRSRNRLLEEPRPDAHWLDAIEHETAELAVAVAATRAETVRRLQAVLEQRRGSATAFPAAEIALIGALERLTGEMPAVAIEDRYRALLRENRARDAQAGRTLEGPHLSDLAVTFAPKQVPATDASTGEQKALLISLVLAQAALIATVKGFAPIVLLDEVVAHLDPRRREALFAEVADSAGQVWMTGADAAAFVALDAGAMFEAIDGRLERRR
jgi:DNA replication and repair protein RecF